MRCGIPASDHGKAVHYRIMNVFRAAFVAARRDRRKRRIDGFRSACFGYEYFVRIDRPIQIKLSPFRFVPDLTTLAVHVDIFYAFAVFFVKATVEGITDTFRHGIIGEKDLNCRIRRFLRLPIRGHGSSRFWKRAILSLGNTICCPTVTYCRANTGQSPFSSELKFNIDWDTFYKFAGKEGEFVYYDAPLAFYRIHDGATSKEFIVDHQREKEDRIMFRKYWPGWMADLILYFYKGAYKTYD